MDMIPISHQGLELVRRELERLRNERPEIIQAIKEAREEGDLAENAGYHAARERQGMLEARIAFLEEHMARFNVIDLSAVSSGVVVYGATVTLENVDSGEKKEYTLLGPDETEYAPGGISVYSPVAKALLGREQGDEVTVEVPRGKITYEILSIEFRGAEGIFPRREADSC